MFLHVNIYIHHRICFYPKPQLKSQPLSRAKQTDVKLGFTNETKLTILALEVSHVIPKLIQKQKVTSNEIKSGDLRIFSQILSLLSQPNISFKFEIYEIKKNLSSGSLTSSWQVDSVWKTSD